MGRIWRLGLPTDQCYRMEPPRQHRGVWIDAFEGQRFIPEGSVPIPWSTIDPTAPGAREAFEHARSSSIWIDARRVPVDRATGRRGTRRFIEFVGRKSAYPGAYGHFGMSGQYIVVDRVLAVRDCPADGACR